jgi:hypothetical protein
LSSASAHLSIAIDKNQRWRFRRGDVGALSLLQRHDIRAHATAHMARWIAVESGARAANRVRCALNGRRAGDYVDVTLPADRHNSKILGRNSDAYIDLFEEKYAAKTAFRATGFRAIFNFLANMRLDSCAIVETGCSRKADGDGVVYGDQVPADHP